LNEVRNARRGDNWPPLGGIDPNFNQTTLLLHGDGINGGQNNTFLDGSTNNFTITRTGNTTQGSFNPYGDRWSNFFDGSGDFLRTPTDAALGMSTGDFTIECFVYVNVYGGTGSVLVDMRSGTEPSVKPDLEYSSSGVLNYRVNGSNVISGGTLARNTWYHVAVCRSGSITKMFIDGVQSGSDYTDNNDYGASNRCQIGADDDGSANAFVNGYISDVRVVKGTALYTAAFTPPTAPLTAISGTSLLTCQSNGFKDSSSNNFAITRFGDVRVTTFSPYAPSGVYNPATLGGSGFFDGSGDYLSIADNAAFALGSSDFTAECWAYFNSSVDQYFFGQLQASTSNRSFVLAIIGSKIYFEARSGTTPYSVTAANNVVLNQWTHLAAVRNGNTITLYQDGTSIGTVDVTGVTINDSTNLMGVGSGGGYVAEPMNGYLSDVRLVVGTALYTAAFTPPTAPLTAVTNTSLLCSFTNAAIFDSTAKNVLETVGDAQIDTSVVKYGTGSMEFDGTGDYLVVPSSPDLIMGTGDFTVEFWLYPTSSSVVFRSIIDTRSSVGTNTGVAVGQNGLVLEVFGDGQKVVSAAGALTIDTWQHVALVRQSGTCQIYVDGTASGSSATYSDNLSGSSAKIGALVSNANPYVGYIDDLRITKGVARYTAAFTPPTAPFPDR
jgi:hypothetical protein